MRSALPLRARLTLFVALAFGAAATVVAVVALDRIEEGLIDDTRSNAEAVLSQYLESINGGVATVGVVDDDVGAQFFYRDDAGRELSEFEYLGLLAGALETELSALAITPFEVAPPLAIDGATVFASPGELDVPTPFVDPETGQLFDAGGAAVTFVMGPVPVGSPEPVDVSEDVVAVSQALVFADGTAFEVGVSNPLRPVTDGLEAVRRLLWFAVPVLVAAVAGITWLAATRALRPVHTISSRAREISAENLEDRLPVPAANDDIRQLVETVNDMLARLDRSQRRQRELVADASHELRSPVAASIAQLEVATAAPAEADWETTARTVLDEQGRLSTLIDDLLALSRLDAADGVADQIVDLGATVRAEAARPRQPTPSVGARPGAATVVSGDPRLLERAMGNVLDNAARHARTRVEVSIARTTSAVVVHVDDDGPGVPAEDRDRVFDRFTRLDEDRARDAGGAGLGLAIARQVARSHGGELTCLESPLGGARFSLEIPALA